MAAPFDAYYTWLGIPPAEQPPHHYRLLGVPPFESDMAVIGNAADRQMVYVKTFVDGPHDETAKRVLAELRTARLCLFDFEQKADYDEKLHSLLSGSGSTSGNGPSHGGEGSPQHSLARPMPRRAISPWGAATSTAPQLPPPISVPPPIPPPAFAAPPQMYSPVYPASPYVPPAPAALLPVAPVPPVPVAPASTVPASTPPAPATPAATLEAQRSASRPVPVDPPPAPTPAEAPAGGSATGARLRDKQSRFREALLYAGGGGLALLLCGIALAYTFGGRSSDLEKVAKRDKHGGATKNPASANSGHGNTTDSPAAEEEPDSNGGPIPPDPGEPDPEEPKPEDKTPDVKPTDPKEAPADKAKPAADPGKPTKPVETPVDSTKPPVESVKPDPPKEPIKVKTPRAIQAHLEGDFLKDRLQAIKELPKQYNSDDERFKVADESLSLLTPLLAGHRLEEADMVVKKAVELRDYCERKNSQKHAEIKDLVASAQIEVLKAKQVQKAFEELKSSPQDKAANTTVGKYYCLVEGDFAKGLPLLARGEEGLLKEAAALDLKSPVLPKDQHKLGDDWYQLGDKEGGFYARAAIWYQRALPELTGVPRRQCEAKLKDNEKIASDPAARKLRRKPGVNVVLLPASATLKLFERQKITAHSGGALFVMFLPDRKSLLSAGADDLIKGWNLADGTAIGELKGHTGSVTAIAVLEDGKKRYSSSADGTLRMWGFPSNQEFKGSSPKMTFVAASNDGRNLATGGSDGSVGFWGQARGQERKSVSAHDGSITCLAFSPDGQTLASAGGETVKIWTMPDFLKITLDHATNVNAVAFSPDGKLIATGGAGNTVELWSADTYSPWQSLKGHGADITSVAFSPDGCWIASADADGEIIIWTKSGGKKHTSLGPRKDRIHCLAYSPDGSQLAAACDGGEILLLDVKVKYSAAEASTSADAKE